MSDPVHELRIEPATAGAVDELVRLEERAFTADRISRRAWRHLVLRAHGDVWLARPAGTRTPEPDFAAPLLGAAAVLYRKGSRAARLYSLAVDPEARGRGVARALLAAALEGARRAGCQRLRLEVRADNGAALGLYRAAGFTPIETLDDYYADGAPGLRMERRL